MKLHATSFGVPSPRHAVSEDVFAVNPCDDGGLLCVLSDGVSAARDPRRCAERVVRMVSDNFGARPSQWPIRKALERLIEEANASLCREGAYLDSAASMQATLAVVCLSGDRLSGINMGDSPVFFVRKKTIGRLSQTHSVRNGDGHDILTNAVGMTNAVTTHYFEQEVQEGDIVVVTSDGVTELLSDTQIGDLARRFCSARALVQEALKSSSSGEVDDLSAIVVEVKDADPSLPEAASLAAHPFPKLAKGEIVDGFHLIRPMANNLRVWLAEKNEQRVILKFSPQEAASDDTGMMQARFSREARNACRFKDDFFVPASLPASGSPHYYVQDYVEAPSLRFLLKSRRLSTDEAVELGKFLARAEQRLLGHELIHGDIKPDNILIFRTGDDVGYKLLDLGLASSVFTDCSVAGTATYLAPERFSGAVVTERTEIFSIGATLYEMLTGQPPFGAIERFQKPHFTPARRPSYFNPNVPPWLDAVVMKCLSLPQTKRFQHFSELLFSLEHPDSAPADAFDSEPLLSRDPQLLYKIGFWLFFAATVFLLFKLFGAS